MDMFPSPHVSPATSVDPFFSFLLSQDFLEYKCRFCCSVAVWFCFGTTHFCDKCHQKPGHMQTMQKEGKLPHCPAGPQGKQLPDGPCPLKVPHPPEGEEFALGCGVCRNAQTF